MTIDLTKLPRHGLRFAVLSGLVTGFKTKRRVYFSGASRQKIGSALSHLRLAGWPLRDAWLGNVHPGTVIGIRLAGSSARKVPLPKAQTRAKVYSLSVGDMEAYLDTLGAEVRDEIGFSRWKVLEKIGLVEPAAV